MNLIGQLPPAARVNPPTGTMLRYDPSYPQPLISRGASASGWRARAVRSTPASDAVCRAEPDANACRLMGESLVNSR